MDLFWGAITLPLLLNTDPSFTMNFQVNDIAAAIEADEPVDAKGYLQIPMADGICQAHRQMIANDLAQVWPSLDEVECEVTERYSYMRVATEITVAPPDYEGLPTPEIIIEAKHTGPDSPAYARLTLRSTQSILRLLEAMTDNTASIPVLRLSLVIENDSPQPISLSLSPALVENRALEAGTPLQVEPGKDLGFTLSNVASALLAQGDDHQFGTLTFLLPGD